MINFKDKTFCSTPHCKNNCGRKMTQKDANDALKAGLPISYHPFCEPKSIDDIIKQDLEKLARYLSKHWQNTKDRKNNN